MTADAATTYFLPGLCAEAAPRQGCFVGLVPLARMALSTYTDVVGPNGLRPALYLEKFEDLKNTRYGFCMGCTG